MIKWVKNIGFNNNYNNKKNKNVFVPANEELSNTFAPTHKSALTQNEKGKSNVSQDKPNVNQGIKIIQRQVKVQVFIMRVNLIT